jgi:hypothetical protein
MKKSSLSDWVNKTLKGMKCKYCNGSGASGISQGKKIICWKCRGTGGNK